MVKQVEPVGDTSVVEIVLDRDGDRFVLSEDPGSLTTVPRIVVLVRSPGRSDRSGAERIGLQAIRRHDPDRGRGYRVPNWLPRDLRIPSKLVSDDSLTPVAGARGISRRPTPRLGRPADSHPRVTPVVVDWSVDASELPLVANAIRERLDGATIRNASDVETKLVGLVDGRTLRHLKRDVQDDSSQTRQPSEDERRLAELMEALFPVSDYPEQLKTLATTVGEYEGQFRQGQLFKLEVLERIETTLGSLGELEIREQLFRATNNDGDLSTLSQAISLRARLVRLLDALADREGRGYFDRVVSVLAAFLLVPTLVAGVYGANVLKPFDEGSAFRWESMLAFMCAGSALALFAVLSISNDPDERAVKLIHPSFEGDAMRHRGWAWTLQGVFGVGLATTCSALIQIPWSTTFVVLSTAALALLIVTMSPVGAAIAASETGKAKRSTWAHAAVPPLLTGLITGLALIA